MFKSLYKYYEKIIFNVSESINSDISSQKLDMSIRTASIKDVHSYVGFANFPNQVFRRAVKNGFEFTLMVVGTFVHLFLSFLFPSLHFFV